MDFFQFRERQLNESPMTDALNTLQDYWSDNAEYFMDQDDPLFPILSRPFDRIRKGGVLVIGINPGSGTEGNKKRTELVNMFSGKQPPAFNNRTRTWRSVDFDKVNPKNRGGKEKNVGFSVFDTKEWEKRGGGGSKYITNLSTILKKIDRSDLSGKVMNANIIPFPSRNEGSFRGKQAEMMKLGFAWVRELIKTSKPKVIITAGNKPWNALEKGMMTRTVPAATLKAIKRDTGEATKVDIAKVGFIGKIPVIGLHHPSIGAGQPGSINFEGEQLEKLQAIFREYVK